ncbi:MAG: VWA domain-containing protein [Planctomycetota bacterium]|jgi:Ca-activated chloride channel family protein
MSVGATRIPVAAVVSTLALGLAASGSGLQPIGTSAPVSVEHVSFDVRVRGLYASATMEVVFVASSGDLNSGNFRFPLPAGAVIHGADLYLAAEDRWEPAETVGRREGEIIYEDITDPMPPIDPLLVQEIGKDLYRARVYPINSTEGLMVRIHYAHVLERTPDGAALRIAFESVDSVPATPAGGVRIAVELEPNTWNGGNWEALNDIPWVKDFDGGAGCAHLVYEDVFTMDSDIVLNLVTPGGTPDAGALGYTPTDSSLEPHVHAWWCLDLAAYPSALAAPRSVVFVVDRSGSMSGSKMAETKKAVIACLADLDPEDRFGVVAFSHAVTRFDAAMRPASDAPAAAEWVRGLAAGGGTDISLGLREGAAVGATTPLAGAGIDLFLITDANANVGTTTSGGILTMLTQLSAAYGRDIRVFGCGMGSDLVQDFVNELALKTGAEATFALADAEISGQITDLFARVRGGGVSDAECELVYDGRLPDEPFRWRRVFDRARLSVAARGEVLGDCTLSLAGTCPDGSPVSEGRLVLPESYADPFDRIAAPLAAKAWADRLERSADEEGETALLVTEAVILAKTYGIVTRYSSMLALESAELYDQYGIVRPPRDEAGIALEPVTGSSTAEQRIGGEGTWDSLGAPAGGGWGGGGCRPVPGAGAGRFPAVVAALWALAFTTTRRRRRRGAGAWRER